MHDARRRSWAPCRLVSFHWFWRMFHWNKFICRLHTMWTCVCMNSPIQTLCSQRPRFLDLTKSSSMSLQAPFFPIHVMHKILDYVSSKTSTEMLLLGHKVHGWGCVGILHCPRHVVLEQDVFGYWTGREDSHHFLYRHHQNHTQTQTAVSRHAWLPSFSIERKMSNYNGLLWSGVLQGSKGQHENFRRKQEKKKQSDGSLVLPWQVSNAQHTE